MANKIKSSTFGAPEKQILIAEDSFKVTLGAIIGNTGVEADDEGKKILRAGTPLTGDITDRDAEHAFVLATTTPAESGEDIGSSDATAILLHDVDVTAGDENGTIVIVGVVDLKKLDADTAALIDDETVAALPTIKFINS